MYKKFCFLTNYFSNYRDDINYIFFYFDLIFFHPINQVPPLKWLLSGLWSRFVLTLTLAIISWSHQLLQCWEIKFFFLSFIADWSWNICFYNRNMDKMYILATIGNIYIKFELTDHINTIPHSLPVINSASPAISCSCPAYLERLLS